MATPTGVLAIIRASRPTFRSRHDKLVFAVHAILSANGLRLLAVGETQTDAPDASVLSRTDEAPLDGWNTTGVVDEAVAEAGGSYSFLYALDPEPSSKSTPTAATASSQLLVKALAIGPALLVNLLADPAPDKAVPETLELHVDHFAPDGAATASFSHMDELVARVTKALGTQVKPATQAQALSAQALVSTSGGQGTTQGAGRGQGQGQGRGDEDFDPLRDYSQPGRRPGGGLGPYPPRNPLMVGEGDVMPGFGGAPTFGGGMGGMHMGPGHPAFAGRARQPPGIGPGIGPGHMGGPGMRWDPIAPEGLQGWNPDDFTRGGRGGGRGRGMPDIDPDIMQPGPGRGTDWDRMFG